MAFLNALGTVSRGGQWRLRRVFRASLADGRLDLTETGLIDFVTASAIDLTVTRRERSSSCCWPLDGAGSPAPVLRASLADGTVFVSEPGILEALFSGGVMRGVEPGLHDVRISVTLGPETAEIFNEPVLIR